MSIRRPNPVLEKSFDASSRRGYAAMPETAPQIRDERPNPHAHPAGGSTVSDEHVMTLEGTVSKTGLLLTMLGLSAAVPFVGPVGMVETIVSLFPFLALTTFAVAMVVAFKPLMAAKLAAVFAVLEGLLLGSLSRILESSFPGIASQALVLTFGVAAAMLLLYRIGYVKVTQNFRIAVISAILGVALVYLVSLLGSFLGFQLPLLHENTPAGIVVSLVIIALAAANLALDFDFVEHGVEQRFPRSYEWVGAFGLVVTLAWLYIEILRLLAKIRSRD